MLTTTTISTRTLSWWVNIKSLGGSQATAGGFGISAYYDKFESIVWNERATNEGWFFGSSGYGRSGSTQAFASSTPLNTWYMVTAVYDNDYKMYIDDILLFSIPSAGYLQTFSYPYRYVIGPRAYFDNTAWGYIDGAVGEAIVWERALSSNEVSSLYDSTRQIYKETQTQYSTPTSAPTARGLVGMIVIIIINNIITIIIIIVVCSSQGGSGCCSQCTTSSCSMTFASTVTSIGITTTLRHYDYHYIL